MNSWLCVHFAVTAAGRSRWPPLFRGVVTTQFYARPVDGTADCRARHFYPMTRRALTLLTHRPPMLYFLCALLWLSLCDPRRPFALALHHARADQELDASNGGFSWA